MGTPSLDQRSVDIVVLDGEEWVGTFSTSLLKVGVEDEETGANDCSLLFNYFAPFWLAVHCLYTKQAASRIYLPSALYCRCDWPLTATPRSSCAPSADPFEHSAAVSGA